MRIVHDFWSTLADLSRSAFHGPSSPFAQGGRNAPPPAEVPRVVGPRCGQGHGPGMVPTVLKRRESAPQSTFVSVHGVHRKLTQKHGDNLHGELSSEPLVPARRGQGSNEVLGTQASPRAGRSVSGVLLKATERACRSSGRTTTLPLSATKQTLRRRSSPPSTPTKLCFSRPSTRKQTSRWRPWPRATQCSAPSATSPQRIGLSLR
jgi:hypothetical protein